MKRCLTILVAYTLYASIANSQKASVNPTNDRTTWLNYMDKVARPVFSALAEDRLKEKMQVVLAKNVDNPDNRAKVSYLEAFGRTYCGIAPWLNNDDGNKEEKALRSRYREWTIKGIRNAVNPSAKDYMKWDGGQPLVDASFVALALVRSPWIWQQLDTITKRQVVQAFITTRNTVPVYSNWLLFSAMIETFFCYYDLPYDAVRIDYGIREFFQHWYTGDGMFSDGMQFHVDYYNSYVIQPYLAVILETISKKSQAYNGFISQFDSISKRYAEIQERLINTDGSFPLTGRSIVYRGGAFHHLADVSLRKKLPASIKPSQVRSALTAVIRKTLEAAPNFTSSGWLNIGVNGDQPGLAERYITTGSLYLCSVIFLPLGLPETDEFWSAPAGQWSSVKAWSGQDLPADHALDIRIP